MRPDLPPEQSPLPDSRENAPARHTGPSWRLARQGNRHFLSGSGDIRTRPEAGGPGIVQDMGNHHVKQAHGTHMVHDGPRQASPLALIHGSGSSSGSWGPAVPALAGRHHAIRIDLPGHGQPPPASSYDAPAQAGRPAGALALISSGPSPDALVPQPAALRALIGACPSASPPSTSRSW
ncbi:hypothetical protein GCM10022245_12380 [Streptomyces mayteni]